MPQTTSAPPSKPTPAHVLMDAVELSAVLRCKPRTIAAWEREGKIPPSIRIGRRRLWPAGTVERLLASVTPSPAAANCLEGGAQ